MAHIDGQCRGEHAGSVVSAVRRLGIGLIVVAVVVLAVGSHRIRHGVQAVLAGDSRFVPTRLNRVIHRIDDSLRQVVPGDRSHAIAWAASAEDRIVINANRTVRTIPPGFFGINYVGFWDQAQGSPTSARALAQTAIKTVRFPGGAPADWYDWQDPTYKGWSSTSPMQLWRFTRSFGGTNVVFGTNYQGNVPDPPGKPYKVNSPENAAAWAKFNRNHGIRAAMEVGNEEDVKLLHTRDDPALDVYSKAFNAQAQAMHQAAPGVRVLGPAGTNEWYWWGLDGLGRFLEKTGNRTGTGQVDGISLHFYKGTNWNDARGVAQYWLSSNGPWSAIQSMLGVHDTRRLPVYITEWNLGSSDFHNTFTPTVGHALVTADLIGAFATSGVTGEDYFDLHGAGGWGLLYGTGETRPVDTPTPTYYAMALWARMGSKILTLQQQDDPSKGVSAYATAGKNGSIQVMLINKLSALRPMQLVLQGLRSQVRHVSIYSLQPRTHQVTDTNAVYNGRFQPSPQHALPGPVTKVVRANPFKYQVPGYSVTVLAFRP